MPALSKLARPLRSLLLLLRRLVLLPVVVVHVLYKCASSKAQHVRPVEVLQALARQKLLLTVIITATAVLWSLPAHASHVHGLRRQLRQHGPLFGLPADTPQDKGARSDKLVHGYPAPVRHAVTPTFVSDYANYLVDAAQLGPDARWVVRTVETAFDGHVFHGDATYPTGDAPVDTQVLGSLERPRARLVPRHGFQTVHAPGTRAVLAERKHAQDAKLNDYGEVYDARVRKNMKKEELYMQRIRKRPPPPGPPDDFVLRWPPSRVEAVQREKEAKARQAELDAIAVSRGEPTAEQRDDAQWHYAESYALDDQTAAAMQAEREHEPCATTPMLHDQGTLTLRSAGRGMGRAMRARTGVVAGVADPGNNLFLEGSDSFDTSVADLSSIFFVVSSTYARLHNDNWALLDGWARFMTNGHGRSNGAFVLVRVHRPRADEADRVGRALRERGIFGRASADPGDDREGRVGDARSHDLPYADPAPVRYANALAAAVAFHHDHFVLGGMPEAWSTDADGRDRDMHGNVIVRHVRRRPAFALVDDDMLFASAAHLVHKLKEHRLVSDSANLSRPDWSDAHFDTKAVVLFPSDPYTDWTFHTGASRTALRRLEQRTVGPRQTKDLPDALFHDNTTHAAAWSAGAVFMTDALASRIAELPCLRRSTPDGRVNEAARDEHHRFGRQLPEQPWDEQILRCARDELDGLVVRVVPSFFAPADLVAYSSDSVGDDLGRLHQYTGGTHPLALHNHALHQYDAIRALQIADVCGDDCFLQRYHFDDNWVLVNGHSLTHFSGPVSDVVARSDAKSDPDVEGFLYDAAPRPAGDVHLLRLNETHRTYRLLDTTKSPDGTVVQAYVRRRRSGMLPLDATSGRRVYAERARHMAVPRMAQGGLEPSDDELDAEDERPRHDEVVVLIWRPAAAPPVPHGAKRASDDSSWFGVVFFGFGLVFVVVFFVFARRCSRHPDDLRRADALADVLDGDRNPYDSRSSLL